MGKEGIGDLEWCSGGFVLAPVTEYGDADAQDHQRKRAWSHTRAVEELVGIDGSISPFLILFSFELSQFIGLDGRLVELRIGGVGLEIFEKYFCRYQLRFC